MSASVARPSEPPLSFDLGNKVRATVVGLAFIAVFYHELLNLNYKWWTSADWSHGYVIPFFSIYLIYTHWDQVRRSESRHHWVGLALIFLALGVYQYSIWGTVIGYLRPFSMLLCLLGVIIYLCGLPILRHVWIPWLYLFFAVPLPKSIYFALTDPLRQIAATVATAVLSLIPSLMIEKAGSTIQYIYQGTQDQLEVADACSGMRSAVTLCALGVAVTFVSDRPWWQRIIMIAACLPIAVFGNLVRVTVTCVLHIFVDPKYAQGSYHMTLGLVIIAMALGIFLLLGWVLDNLVVEESETGEPAAG